MGEIQFQGRRQFERALTADETERFITNPIDPDSDERATEVGWGSPQSYDMHAGSMGIMGHLLVQEHLQVTKGGYEIRDSAGSLLISKAGTNLLRLDSVGNLAIAGTLSQSQTL